MERLSLSVSTNGGPPVACDLDALDDDDRAEHLARAELLVASCVGHTEEVDGVVLRYQASVELIEAAGAWIARERLCCSFFDFELAVPAGGGEFTIRLGGGPEIKEFVLENFVRAAKAGA